MELHGESVQKFRVHVFLFVELCLPMCLEDFHYSNKCCISKDVFREGSLPYTTKKET